MQKSQKYKEINNLTSLKQSKRVQCPITNGIPIPKVSLWCLYESGDSTLKEVQARVVQPTHELSFAYRGANLANLGEDRSHFSWAGFAVKAGSDHEVSMRNVF